MKKYTFILSFLLISTNIFGETNIFGHWLTSGSIVKIENCDDYICAKIETLFVEEGVDPKQILDDQNKDKSLRSRPLVGINILDNFLIKDINQKTFKGGKIYDPRRGKTYKSNLYLNDNGILRVEGCVAFICDGEDWRPLEVTINEDGSKEAVLKNSSQSD
tara:strand:+ start:425 stop:907 length:483 start_codon:yes stop_codon:yes gene_type:complete